MPVFPRIGMDGGVPDGLAAWKVVAPSALLTGLQSYWKFNEASGSRADSHGTNTLTDNNTVTQAAGKLGNAAQFTAANSESLSHVSTASLQTGDIDWTVAGWFYLDSTAANQVLVGKWQSGGYEYLIAWQTGTSRLTLFYSSNGSATSSMAANTFGALTAGTWYYVMAWHDSVNNTLNLSINGVTDSISYSGGFTAGAQPFIIGRAESVWPLGGRADSVGYWKRVLTAPERANLYNSGVGLEYPFSDAVIINLTLTTPTAYRTFQRSGTTGTIAITGVLNGGPYDIEARWNGGSYTTIVSGANGSFSGNLTSQAQGQGTLDVRLVALPSVIVSVLNVGIGDVFITAGQSNSGGQGTNNQVYSHATLKATLFGNDYTWKNLADPTDSNVGQVDTVSADGTAGGSVWPLLATSYLASTGIPVAFVPCALTNTSITQWQPGANHQDRTTLYGSMVYRALQTGAKCVLWWQGETDALGAMSQATYNAYLDTIANSVQADLGVKLMVCKLQNCSGTSDVLEAAINNAIGDAWADNTNVLQGPDLSDIPTDDSFHLKTDGHLATAASRWWVRLQAAFGYA